MPPQLLVFLEAMLPEEGGGEYAYAQAKRVGNLNDPSMKKLGNMITLTPLTVGNVNYPGSLGVGN